MAVNNGLYDFFIISDDREWESRILQKLQRKGFSGYHRGRFILGGLKTSSRLHGVKKSWAKIIGFPSPSKKQTEIGSYVASLTIENWKKKDLVICIPISKDSRIPEDYSPFTTDDEDLDEDTLCNRIAEAIESVKSGESVPRSNTGDTDSSIPVNQEFRRGQGLQHGGGDGHDETDIPAPANNIARGQGVQNQQVDDGGDDGNDGGDDGNDGDDDDNDGDNDGDSSDDSDDDGYDENMPADRGVGDTGRGLQLMKWLPVVSCSFVTLLIAYILQQVGIQSQLILLIIMLMFIIAFIVYNFATTTSFSRKQKALFLFSIFVSMLIICGVIYKFDTILSFLIALSITQKCILAFVIILFGIAIFGVWYNFTTILSFYKSLSRGQAVAFVCFIFTIVLILLGVLPITVPLLKFLYELLISFCLILS